MSILKPIDSFLLLWFQHIHRLRAIGSFLLTPYLTNAFHFENEKKNTERARYEKQFTTITKTRKKYKVENYINYDSDIMKLVYRKLPGCIMLTEIYWNREWIQRGEAKGRLQLFFFSLYFLRTVSNAVFVSLLQVFVWCGNLVQRTVVNSFILHQLSSSWIFTPSTTKLISVCVFFSVFE